MPAPVRALWRRTIAVLAGGALAGALLATATAGDPAAAGAGARGPANPVTPGDFTGYGFDQCLTPSQATMDRWLQSSPFLAVGVYMAGNSRACRNQPELTATWVQTQLRNGWRILPITLGPQASCQPRFPRYSDDPTIIPTPGADNRYGKARKQAGAEAAASVDAAKALGIVAGSTLYYDLEGFDLRNTHCRESALAFLSGWTWKIHQLGYESGVYSSAGSGIKMLDDARYNRRSDIALPDQIWVARWDGHANTDTEAQYLRADGWRPHARIKQYQGGHNETYGGVTINIDRDYLDVGRGSVAVPETHCDGVKIAYGIYPTLMPATADQTPPASKVKVLQCLLQEQGLYEGRINGVYNVRTQEAAQAFQAKRGFRVSTTWTKPHWMSLLIAGDRPVVKYGSAGPAVRRVQRALNAITDRQTPVRATGVYDAATTIAVRAWQKSIGIEQSGVVGTAAWKAFAAGKR